VSQHARLSASAAERWMNCPGSVPLSEATPGTTSFEAVQGTFAHDLAATCLLDGAPASVFLGREAVIDGHKVKCDQEMVDGIQVYLDTCQDLHLKQRWIELGLLDSLSKWDADLGGTADYVTYDPDGKLLRVVDFKYGAGVFVSAEDNKQLMMYAFGAMLAVNKPVEAVEVYIVQPRYEGAAPVRMQLFPAWDLMEFAGSVAGAAAKTRLKDAPLVPGSWCKKTFCPNARTCPALEKYQHAIVAAQFSDVKPYDPKALQSALDAIPLVEERIKAIREFAYLQAMNGRPVPGYKLVAKRARRAWNDETAVIKWAEARAVDPYEPRTLLSPAQMEKAVAKAERKELAPFISSLSSGESLVPESDPRPAISKTVTADDFEVVNSREAAAPKQLTVDNLFQE
jgi:hypothetical protein